MFRAKRQTQSAKPVLGGRRALNRSLKRSLHQAANGPHRAKE